MDQDQAIIETPSDSAGDVVAQPTDEMSTRVRRLADELTKVPQVDCPIRHHFAPGVYAREITIPKGVVLVGAVHKQENLAILSKGRLQLVVDGGTRIIEAPAVVRVMPGMQNAAVALEEAVWTNVFATTETDPDKLVELLTTSKASDLIGGSTNAQLARSGLAQALE